LINIGGSIGKGVYSKNSWFAAILAVFTYVS